MSSKTAHHLISNLLCPENGMLWIPKYDGPFKVMKRGSSSLQTKVTGQAKDTPYDPCKLLESLPGGPKSRKDTS